MSQPLTIQLFDMISQATAGKLSDIIERESELNRLVRILLKPSHHHALIVGDPGSGKTSLITALAERMTKRTMTSLPTIMYQLTTDPIAELIAQDGNLSACKRACQHIAEQVPEGIIFIDDIHLLIADEPFRLEAAVQLLKPLIAHPKLRIIATCTSDSYIKLLKKDYAISRLFEVIELRSFSPEQVDRIIMYKLSTASRRETRVTSDAIQQAINLGQRYNRGRSLPDAAIRLIEEAIVKAQLDGCQAVEASDITEIIAERENIPLSQLTEGETEKLLTLEQDLNQEVIGQSRAIKTIVTSLLRSRMGFADPNRPLGSFLLLGPSGVGKTETARALARYLYQSDRSLVRLDMSEFSESHTSVRLIGSPPGYVGYEEGGQLTNPILREPHSLILLDELEKAHPKLFDIFLQVLDDGRLTDSAGTTVDFTQTLLIATSNCGSVEIAQGFTDGMDVHSLSFMDKTLLPLLMKQFRPEFLNRFDAILVYKPLEREDLLRIAKRELKHLEKRISRRGIKLTVSDHVLDHLLSANMSPLFGARPVKRIIREYFEAPIARELLSQRLKAPLTITGNERWLTK